MTNSEKSKNDTRDSTILMLRKAIDEIDEKILDLINERLSLGGKIGRIKEKNGDQVLDNSRENQILERLLELNKGPLKQNVLLHIFSEIMATSREIQRPELISYLGPEATFTHIVAMKNFGHAVTFNPQMSIQDVFEDVEKEVCKYGVIPIENSSEGTVNHSLDMLFESDLKICAEIYQAISHDLCAATGSLENIREIYSHPQAFAQCRKWLRKHLPDAELIECNSTALAAKEASKKSGSAVIASSEAAQIYNLQILSSRIEDIAKNTTRFLVIGKDETQPTGKDKTSIMFVTAHIPGALHKSLGSLAKARINLLKVESRPIKYENWNYCFFVDIEGHIEDFEVKEAIKEMKSICQYVKWLGSYPRVQTDV